MATCCRLWRWSPRGELGLGRPKLSARQSRSCPSNRRSASERRKPPLAGHAAYRGTRRAGNNRVADDCHAATQPGCVGAVGGCQLCYLPHVFPPVLGLTNTYTAPAPTIWPMLSSRRPDGHRVPANGDSPSHAWLVPVQPVRCSELRQFHPGDFVPVPPRY
jgi:hypothetical protein